ncbi:uncharacterized protein PGTG_20686 [Puccinia graminis f. sp. tritici CRL 75-36-700-3]|uniref:DUF6589 domain-containing protein n=1 Tax=Puccinia graminis f. sp. tritici (strain CRL 75-36-700-3 / race SCCL) TaxID=418459 RepID=H6QPD7_PUCGT|nr:uncharacterized protein PGTG_20686 [Puccinia graminis f. sp. tritici CRL 75-36-700-3]EHS63592.1 hypothetical protein PGTG_20686 [Puccinia graminis f. sp. tritici CRL 75-36-700-3]
MSEKEAEEVRKRHSQSKLSNLLVRLHEFSTVVEADRAMKAGDIGRLINIWRMWSVMSQSLPGLTHYATYLPRLVLLLTKVLPEGLSRFFRHSIQWQAPSVSESQGDLVKKLTQVIQTDGIRQRHS